MALKLFDIPRPGLAPHLIDINRSIASPLTELSIGWTVVPIVGIGPSIRPRKTEYGVVLVRGDWDWSDETRCLVRFSAERIKGTKKAVVIAAGYDAIGKKLALAVVDAGQELGLVARERVYLYSWNGKVWTFETLEERRGRCAVEAVEADKGEWL